MPDTMKKLLIDSLTDACESLSALEDAGEEANSPIQSQARGMLDALEDHLRGLDPASYSVS